MARRKKTSAPVNSKFSVEITGLIFILIGIIGLFVLGPVGMYIKDIGVYLFGNLFYIFDFIMIVEGSLMLFTRKVPNFIDIKAIGIYLILIAVLTYAHINFINNNVTLSDNASKFTELFLNVISDSTYTNLSQTGGGIIGLFFSFVLVKLLSKVGAYIIIVVLLLVGCILLFNIDFGVLIDSIKENVKEASKELSEETKKRKEEHLERMKEEKLREKDNAINKENEETVVSNNEDNKIIIHSVDDLKNLNKENEVINEPNEDKQIIENKPVESVPLININSSYELPKLDQVLDPLKKKSNAKNDAFIHKTSIALKQVLADFQISGEVCDYHEGPTVTQFEVRVKSGTRVAKITSISKEIALALAAKDVRIEAPIPGKSTVGIEIPNPDPTGVPIREVLQSKLKDMQKMKLPVSLGKDINGENCITDLSKMPHLLIAGSTGSGKSVCVNSFIASILITKRPDEVKIMLIDPKKVELSNYNGVPHLLCPVVTDPKKASIALQNVVKEMENRYKIFADEKVKNIGGYNDLITERMKENPEDTSLHLMPYMLIIIDELADLMLVASKEVENSIMRITQMARAAGIHLIVATQRPSTDVITGVVKANIPSRIAFAVASQIDSRTILDMGGAEKLLGKGDMLFKPMGQNNPTRIQGNFISDEEIEKVISYVSSQQSPQYDESYTALPESEDESGISGAAGSASGDDNYEDPLYNEIVDFAIQNGKISASLIQRRFRLGYNRAARVIDLLESRGIIGPQNGSKPREVLVKMEDNNNSISDNQE